MYLTKNKILLTLAIVLIPMAELFALPPQKESIPFAPALRGFGSHTTGGSGRNLKEGKPQIIEVSSLDDSGSGTLRECIMAQGPRTCVFSVSGVVDLKEPLNVKNPFLTIAGQTAPAPGISLHGAGLIIAAHDAVIQHMVIRVGDAPDGPKPSERDGLRIGAEKTDVYNVVADHLTITWAIDENVSVVSGAHDVTLSSLLIAEALDHSIHPKGAHSKGLMIAPNCKNVSVIGNIVALNGERNPLIQPGSTVQFINNVVYGWGQKSYSSLLNLSDSGALHKGVTLDFIGNVFQPAPWATSFAAIYAKPLDPETRIFVRDNLGPTRQNSQSSDWDIVSEKIPESPHRLQAPVFSNSLELARPASETLDAVLQHAGSRPAQRSSVDQRIIEEIRDKKGSIKDCVQSCGRSAGGWPTQKKVRKDLDYPRKTRENQEYSPFDTWLQERAAHVE